MKRSLIDEQSAINAIVRILPGNINLDDFNQLDELVQLGIDWTEAATSIGVPRRKLYHWYYDTYRKRHLEKMTDADKASLLQQIEIGYQMSKISPEFRSKLFKKFSHYDNVVFSAAYNSCLKKCQKANSKNDLLLGIVKVLSDQHQ